MSKIHVSVLRDEVLEWLHIKTGEWYIDATLNGGGHARAIIEKGGRVLGIERDPHIVKLIKKETIKGLTIQQGNYIDMKRFTKKHQAEHIQGVLFDFGMSSFHIDQSGRGFSFVKDEPLDMRYSDSEDLESAAQIVNSYPESELVRIFFAYGEERRARAVARAIVNERKRSRIVTSGHLARVVEGAIPRRGKVHPATRVFQALRIAVNQELECVADGLHAAMDLVAPGGRVAAISFHSLEDRIVKQEFKQNMNGVALTKKPIVAARPEVLQNSRSRSAKLRVWEKQS